MVIRVEQGKGKKDRYVTSCHQLPRERFIVGVGLKLLYRNPRRPAKRVYSEVISFKARPRSDATSGREKEPRGNGPHDNRDAVNAAVFLSQTLADLVNARN